MRVSHHNAKEYLALLKGLNLIAVEQEEPGVLIPHLSPRPLDSVLRWETLPVLFFFCLLILTLCLGLPQMGVMLFKLY